MSPALMVFAGKIIVQIHLVKNDRNNIFHGGNWSYLLKMEIL